MIEWPDVLDMRPPVRLDVTVHETPVEQLQSTLALLRGSAEEELGVVDLGAADLGSGAVQQEVRFLSEAGGKMHDAAFLDDDYVRIVEINAQGAHWTERLRRLHIQ